MAKTTEEIQAHAEELSKKLNVKVHPLLFLVKGSDEQVIGYMKEPPRLVKVRALDKALTGYMTAAGEVLEACLIVDESDPRILSEAPENDQFYLGACMAASAIIDFSSNQLKKK